MKFLILTSALLLGLCTASFGSTPPTKKPSVKPEPQKEEVIPYTMTPDFFKLLFARVKEGRRTADEDALDITAVILSMEKLGYTSDQFGTNDEELGKVLRHVVIKGLKRSVEKLSDEKLSATDRKIEAAILTDTAKMYNIQPEELGTTPEQLEKLLKQ